MKEVIGNVRTLDEFTSPWTNGVNAMDEFTSPNFFTVSHVHVESGRQYVTYSRGV